MYTRGNSRTTCRHRFRVPSSGGVVAVPTATGVGLVGVSRRFILAISLLALPAIAQNAGPGFRLTHVRTDGSTGSVTLAVQAPAEALRTPAGTATAPELLLTCPPGRSVEARIGQARPLALAPLHFYRIQARMQRSGFATVRLSVHEEPGNAESTVLPPMDFLVAPAWEEVMAFYIAPADVTGVWLRLSFSNPTNGLAAATAGLADLEIRDAGALVELSPPRLVTSCDRLEVSSGLATLPFVPSAGAGMYRVTASVTATNATPVWWSVAGGDDTRLWWHRTSEPGYPVNVTAGTSVVQWVYRIPDRRFTHQYMRACVAGKESRVQVENLVLEQTHAEPATAAALGPGTPKYR
jgi:hypothetical protein